MYSVNKKPVGRAQPQAVPQGNPCANPVFARANPGICGMAPQMPKITAAPKQQMVAPSPAPQQEQKQPGLKDMYDAGKNAKQAYNWWQQGGALPEWLPGDQIWMNSAALTPAGTGLTSAAPGSQAAMLAAQDAGLLGAEAVGAFAPETMAALQAGAAPAAQTAGLLGAEAAGTAAAAEGAGLLGGAGAGLAVAAPWLIGGYALGSLLDWW